MKRVRPDSTATRPWRFSLPGACADAGIQCTDYLEKVESPLIESVLEATLAIRRSQRFDNFFFVGMNVVILVSVFVGFAKSYYLAGVFRAPLPNLLVHIHGAAFTAWIVLLIAQTLLVTAGRVDLHRRFGLFGFGLACLVVILGVLVATENLARNFASMPSATEFRAFYAVALSDMLMFSVLIYFAFRERFHPAAHKRLILIATLAILDAAFDRWPVPVPWWDDRITPLLCTYPLLLLLMAYDWWSTGKIQRATLWASAFLVVVQQGRDPFGHIAAWQSFAAWVYTHARPLV
jgi:hypothetical protein